MPTDVKASLEMWHHKRLGLSMQEDEASHCEEQEDVSICGASQTSTSKRSASASVSCPSAKRTPLPSCKESLESGSIQAGFQRQCMMDATREITRLFIRCAIPFNVANTQQWKQTIRTISRIGCEWEGPSGETLRQRELKKEKISIEAQIEPLKETWTKYGCTVLCDGWSDI